MEQAPWQSVQPRGKALEHLLAQAAAKQNLAHPHKHRQGGQGPARAAAPNRGGHDGACGGGGADKKHHQSRAQQGDGDPNGFVVRADHPAKNMAEFIAMARARPGVLNYASAGLGSSGFLTGELLKQAASISMVHVPYKGSGPAITDLIGGQLDGMFESLVTATNYVKGGKLRLLSVSGEIRNKNFPEVPALNEVVPGVVGGAWFGISAPAKLPMPIANRLQTEIQAIVNAPDMLSRLTEMGMTPMPLTGQDFVNFLQAENRRWGPVIRSGKITVE